MSYAAAALATYANMLGTLDHLVTKANAHEMDAGLMQARIARPTCSHSPRSCGSSATCRARHWRG
jgi:hypothetical protein